MLVDERGTSSHCPDCAAPAAKRGRVLACPSCAKLHHRDAAGARNIAGKARHAPEPIARTEHRRVGQPARRDHRRHRYDDRNRSDQPGDLPVLPVPGPPSRHTGQGSLAA